MTWTTPTTRTAGEVPLDVWNDQIINNLLHLHAGLDAVATEWSLTPPADLPAGTVELEADALASVSLWNDVIVAGILLLRNAASAMGTALEVTVTLPDPPAVRTTGEVPSEVWNDELVDNLVALKTALDDLEAFDLTISAIDVVALIQGNVITTLIAPAGRDPGDFLHVQAFRSNVAEPVAGGWTVASGGDSDQKHFTRIADDSSLDNHRVTGDGTAYRMGSLAAVRSPGATWTVGSLATSGSSTAVSVPGVTALGPGDEMIHVMLWQSGNSSGTPQNIFTTPSGFTLLDYAESVVDSNQKVFSAVFRRPVAGAGSIGTTTVNYALQSGGSLVAVQASRAAVSM